MATIFGKKLRKIRIENDMILKDMADGLNVSPSYLSAVENGKRDVPQQWIQLISDYYHIAYAELDELAFISNDKATIKLQQGRVEEDKALYSFARKFRDLDDKDLAEIFEVLNKKR